MAAALGRRRRDPSSSASSRHNFLVIAPVSLFSFTFSILIILATLSHTTYATTAANSSSVEYAAAAAAADNQRDEKPQEPAFSASGLSRQLARHVALEQVKQMRKRQSGNGEQFDELPVPQQPPTATTMTSPTTTAGSRQMPFRAQQQPGQSVNGQSPIRTRKRRSEDVCADRLCYGLPMGCLDRAPMSQSDVSRVETSGSLCSVLVTSKRLIDPYRPVARDIHFELVALPTDGRSNYAAVGFSETGRMSGLVTECLQYRDSVTQLQIIKLAHSYNIVGAYKNVPVTILSGVKNLGVSYENGYYQCRWVVESAVEFTYEDPNGTVINKREDLGYKNYHILLASGEYNERSNEKNFHSDRVSSMKPISLAQTGLVKSLGSHILIRIHGSLMVVIWIGLVTLSIMLARYYKNEWANSKINELAIWFVLHRAFMLIAWFGSIIAVIFAYMYTETYHAGVHQVAGTSCLVLSTIQVLGGLLRPSLESNKRAYFNWTHFICGNLSYLFAMISIVTAAFLAPAHLPPLYIWVVAAFVGIYALTHLFLTIHQYIVHKSSKISITPKGNNFDGDYVKDSYPFRQVMLGILVAIVIFIVLLLLWIITIRAT